MSEMDGPIRQARRRLWLNRWLAGLGWSLSAAAALFILLVMLQRSFAWISWEPFLSVLAALLALAALLGALVWTLWTAESLSTAAARLDEAAGLKERLSSSMFARGSDDPFARAVVADAVRVSRGLTVKAHLPLQTPYSANYAAPLMLAALLAFWLFPVLDLAGADRQREQERQNQELVARSEAVVRPLVQKTIDNLGENNPELQKELDNLDPLQAAGLQTPLDVRRQALKMVEQVSDKLREKQQSEELAKVDEFRKMLRRAAAAARNDSTVGKLAQALSQSDFKSAQAAIEALQQQLAKTPRTDAEKQQAEQLRQQLKQLSEKLNEIAKDDNKLRDQLRQAGLTPEQMEKALQQLKQGNLDEVAKQLADKGLTNEQIQQMMQDLKKRCNACNAMGQLASNLGMGAMSGAGQQGQQAQQAGGQSDTNAGESPQAAGGQSGSLAQAAQQLSEMEALSQELNELGSSLAELDNTKEKISQSCSACQGSGSVNGQPCGACQGSGCSGMGPNIGRGRGGVAPEQQTAINTVRQRTAVKTTAGAVISQRFVNGEQYKGEFSPEFVNAALTAGEAPDAGNQQPIPRVYQSSVKSFFTRVRDGLPEDTGQETPGQNPAEGDRQK